MCSRACRLHLFLLFYATSRSHQRACRDRTICRSMPEKLPESEGTTCSTSRIMHVNEASAVLLFVFTSSAFFTSVLIPLLPRGMSFVYFWRKNTPSLKNARESRLESRACEKILLFFSHILSVENINLEIFAVGSLSLAISLSAPAPVSRSLG